MAGEKKEEMPAEMQQFLDELKQMTEGASPTERMRVGQVVAEMMISLAAEQAPTAKEIAEAPPHLRGMLESLSGKGRRRRLPERLQGSSRQCPCRHL